MCALISRRSVGSVAQMVEHVLHTQAAELFVSLAHDEDVAPERAAFEHPLQGFEQRRHPGLRVAGAASEHAPRLHHRIEGVDLHSVDRDGVDVAGDQQGLGVAPRHRLGDDARPSALPHQRRVEAESAQLLRQMLRDRVLAHDLRRNVVAPHRIDRGNRDEVAQVADAGREIGHGFDAPGAVYPSAPPRARANAPHLRQDGPPGTGLGRTNGRSMQRAAMMMILSALSFSAMTSPSRDEKARSSSTIKIINPKPLYCIEGLGRPQSLS